MSEQEDHWDILEHSQKELKALCYRMCRGQYYLIDEMMGEITDRADAIAETYDPTYGLPFRNHFFGSVKRYLWKWMNKQKFSREILAEPTYEINHEFRLEVSNILEHLSKADVHLLVSHVVLQKSFNTLSLELNVSHVTVRKRFMQALSRAKAISDRRSSSRL